MTREEIPSCLLPRAIALQGDHGGDPVCRVSGKRTHWHHYHVSVRTKRLRRELAPVARVSETPGTAKGKKKPGRRCAV